MNVYQFLEKIDQRREGTYQSVATRASEEIKMVEVLSTFSISYNVFVSYTFSFY